MLSRQDFRRFRRYLKKNPHIIDELFDSSTKYDASKIYISSENGIYTPNENYLRTLHPCAPIFYELLHVVVQLGGMRQFQGISRRSVIKFINRCSRYLDPSYDLITTQTEIFGDEALRILNHMAFTMLTWH